MNREPEHPRAPTPRPQVFGHRLRPLAVLAAIAMPVCMMQSGAAAEPNAVPSRLDNPQSTIIADPSTVNDTLRVLSVLHSYGYTINTPDRADRAIRHWQHANGITADGQVGPETLSSLHLTPGPTPAPVPAVRDNLPPEQSVEQTIRDVWPDDVEDRAVAIATRESRLVPTARNSCCWGLFQIHWRAHRAWLAGMGVTNPQQLLDPATNAQAALELYRAAGWQPWSL